MVEPTNNNSFKGNIPGINHPFNEQNFPNTRPEPVSNHSELLTVNDVSRMLNIHVNTVRRWSDQGVFKPIRLGARGDRRYKLQDINEFLLSGRSEVVPPKK
jgi:hypothetical protein